MNITQIYRYHIYNLYKQLTDEDKINFKSKINKIFEYYSCIKLSEEYRTPYYEYLDIPADFKEKNNLSILDTGIDCCDLNNSIVQCKLRTNSLTWKDCATFIASKNAFDEEKGVEFVRWQNAIISRNDCSSLSINLTFHKFRFIDKQFSMKEMYDYCDNIKHEEFINTTKDKRKSVIKLRDYQIEAIDIIKNQKGKNVIIKLPTGSGKNLIIINSLDLTNLNNKYLILVPRIVLMEQFQDLLISNGVKKSLIQCVGNTNSKFKEDKIITICVYNSIEKVINNINIFTKIYIDEAHHIYYPDLYKEDDNEVSDVEEKEESYISTIRNLHILNKLVYLSATIDPIEEDLYYEKSLDYMISNDYLSDYQIVIPVFKEDPTNTNITEYLLNRYFHTIIYCENQNEGKKFNELLNKSSKGCSMYIDCKTKQKERKHILDLFQKGELRYLVNVRILTEGFDAPITKSIMFLHMPTSRNTIIQCVGRALRKHSDKINAKIILPYSTDEDSINLTKFVNILSKVDSRCKKYKVNINKIQEEVDDIKSDEDENSNSGDEEEDENSLNFKYEQLFDNISLDGKSYWYDRLNELENYIHKNKKTPSVSDKNLDIKKLGTWFYTQKTNYKKDQFNMKDSTIKISWEEFILKYQEYFQSNEEKWYNKLNDLEKYIKENNKTPSQSDKNLDIKKLGQWLCDQKKNYKKENQIMKDSTIIKVWEDFTLKYKDYMKDREDIWYDKLNELETYIKENNKIPAESDKKLDIKKLGQWSSTQKTNYKTENKIMKDPTVRKIWEDFTLKYKESFLNREEIWYARLYKVVNYIELNKKTPKKRNKILDIKQLGQWIMDQKKKYKKEKDIMKDSTIRKVWEEFTSMYQEYL